MRRYSPAAVTTRRSIGNKLISIALLLWSAPGLASEGLRAIPPGHEQDILALAAPLQLGSPVAGGYHLINIVIEGRGFSFILEGDGLESVRVRVTADDLDRGHQVDVSPPEGELSPAASEAVTRLRETVLPRVDASFWERVLELPTTGREIHSRLSTSVTFAIAGIAFLLILLLEFRNGSKFSTVSLAGVFAVVPLAVWYFTWGDPEPGVDADALEAWRRVREHHLVKLALGVAIAALVPTTVAAARHGKRMRVSYSLWVDAGLVFVWSLVVRFGLTTANVLTDGGSGWSRLLEYRRGFGGLAVLLDLVLPDATMWDAILLPRLLAALSPPLLVLFAHAVGVSRRSAALAGLAFASWPVHAALYTSDFESGAIVSVLIAGLALIASGANRRSASAVSSGLCLLAFGIFGRPEMLIVGLPFVVLAWQVPRDVWRHPAVAAALVWFGSVAIARVVSLSGLSNSSWQTVGGPWAVLPLKEFLTTSALLPYWLWAPLPLGLLWLRGRALAVTVTGLVAGVVPIHMTPTMYDPTETYLEFFRYGAFAMPWLALLAGAGLACVVALLSRLSPRIAPWATAAVTILLVATPLINRDYLALRYGPAIDEGVFREALGHVPPHCRLIVPDDSLAFDTAKRYVEIAREVSSENPQALSPAKLVGISTVLRNPTRDGCWYFYRGSYCYEGFDGTPPIECRELLDREPFEEVWSRKVEYRSHRLVTRPRRKVSPWYEPELSLTLYRRR